MQTAWKAKKTKPARKNKTKDSQKQPRSGIYKDGCGSVLFVPTEKMWQIREAKNFSNVCRRAEIDSKKKLAKWRTQYGREHWFWKYLYGAESPREQIKDADAICFRKTASLNATCRHLNHETQATAKRRDLFSPPTIMKFLNDLAAMPGVRGWQLHNGELSNHVVVASEAQVRQCRIAWHYGRIQQMADVSDSAYRTFFSYFPREQLAEFTRWLYGGREPVGWYMVPEQATALKFRLGPFAIARAAGVSYEAVARWQKDPTLSAALNDAVDFAMRLGTRGAIQAALDKHSTAWGDIETRFPWGPNAGQIKDAILRYATASAWGTAFFDVGMTSDHVNEGWSKLAYWKRSCRKTQADDERGKQVVQAFEDYIRTDRTFDEGYGIVCKAESAVEPAPGQPDRTNAEGVAEKSNGLVQSGLFVPTPKMWQFRPVASRIWCEQRIHNIENAMPTALFRSWFLDWVLPPVPKAESSKFGDRPAGIDAIDQRKGTPRKPEDGERKPETPAADARVAEGQTSAAKRGTRRKSPNSKHLKWKTWRDDGMTFGQIVQKHFAETGETRTRSAISQALDRLPDRC